MIGLLLRLPKYMVYYGFPSCFILVISVLAKRLAVKSVSDMTYIVSSGTSNLNSINQSLTGQPQPAPGSTESRTTTTTTSICSWCQVTVVVAGLCQCLSSTPSSWTCTHWSPTGIWKWNRRALRSGFTRGPPGCGRACCVTRVDLRGSRLMPNTRPWTAATMRAIVMLKNRWS